jgi:hypothetical protein
MWNHESGKQDWRPEIHLQDLIDRFRFDGFGRSDRHHRGVVYQAIDSAEGRGCSFHKRGDLRHVSQIDWYGKNLRARFLNHLLRFPEFGHIEIADRHPGSFSRKGQGDAAPDSVTGSGHDCDFIL